jgi:hypothetical protein
VGFYSNLKEMDRLDGDKMKLPGLSAGIINTISGLAVVGPT